MGKLDGHCLCGQVTYTCDAEPIAAANCHCHNCQRSTGSAFSTVVVAPAAAFEIHGDTLGIYDTVGDSGSVGHRHFCTNCGSPLATKSEAAPTLVYIKAGTLNDTSFVAPTLDVWGDSKQAWSEHGERMTLPQGPTAEMIAALAR
jgi:hypothetical protein